MTIIEEVAARLGLSTGDLEPYGSEIAKVKPQALAIRNRPSGKLILVSAITPTPAGEGKTTTSIGLAQGMARLGESVCLALREPSLGPCMGKKGGGTGGGRCEILPSDRINLHFTGDFHAVTAAHNLLAAIIDNHLYFGNPLQIDPRRIVWKRVLDVNDRALRDIVIGLGGDRAGVPRETGFDITAASELMAMLCLAEDAEDLRQRIDRTLVGFRYDGSPVTASELSCTGAILALLREALMPNLVRTSEGVPAFVHGGPFANIAHGCNSVIATRCALGLANWAITEAGFGFDLGAEKFYDIKCRSAGLDTAAVVLVATVRALKLHGGKSLKELEAADDVAVQRGLGNLDKHLENIQHFCETAVVALNRFGSDTDEEIAVVRQHCAMRGVPFAETDHFIRGGEGAQRLAELVVEKAEAHSRNFCPLYELTDSVEQKIRAVATKMYGAETILFSKRAASDLKDIERFGWENLPVCIAKTHSSLSDDPKLVGRPRNFEINVERIYVNSGAGFLVVITSDIVRMPGLPRRPLAESFDLLDGQISGL
ncbi:MAG: formate--tetrahydrofolate ligase [bacterium]|nr:formate--tetrahydrofolate ligase [bacterium]